MFDEIKKIREKSAKFYKADFHIHSPLSYDWKNENRGKYKRNPHLDRISRNEITPESVKTFCKICKSSGLQIAAITDHMKYGFALNCADYAKKDMSEFLVLPGLELNIKIKQPLIENLRIHVLAIFPPDVGTAIDRIFPPKFPDEAKRKGQEEIECNDIKEIVKKIEEIGGLAIAAHIYNENGARYIYTKATELLLEPVDEVTDGKKDKFYKKVCDSMKSELCKFSCLQVKRTTDPIHFLDETGELRIPLIISSDAHHPKGIGLLENITFIKMGRLDYHSLKEALKFPDTRIRFKDNLPEAKPPRLLGIRMIGKKENPDAFFKNTIIGFSDNLTCVIGPRGSGKSALIDGIRYLMGYNRTLDEIPKVKDQVIDRQLHTLVDSKIELLYEKSDGIIHRLEATFDPNEGYNTKVYDKDNNELNISDIEESGEYPLNLYGWNELELLAENSQSQRENLDKFIPELSGLKKEKTGLYNSLKTNRELYEDQLEKLDHYFDSRKITYSFLRLNEYEKEYRKLNTPAIGKHFKTIDEINRKIIFLTDLEQTINDTLTKIHDISRFELEEIIKEYADIKKWVEELTEKRLEVKPLNDSILKSKASLEGKIKGVLEIINKESINLNSQRLAATKDIQKVIGTEDAITADLRNNAKKRYENTKKIYESYLKEIENLNKLMRERKIIINSIKDTNRRIFATRNEQKEKIKDKIQLVQDKEFIIKLELEQSGDRTHFENALAENMYSLNFYGQWKRRKVPEIISSKLTPFEFTNAILNKQKDILKNKITLKENDIQTTYEIDDDYAEHLITDNIPYEEIADLKTRKYNKEKLTNLLLIQEVAFDDKFYIKLGDKPIQYCSPGQRCSAMLPIVTLTSDAPIIIDQPEDNLDNRLVSRAIFKILAKLKETRQIIVATHNPNILVSGDAEQVIVLKSDGTIEDYGSIDESSIIAKVIDLMEGGKEAFQKREKKYYPFMRK